MDLWSSQTWEWGQLSQNFHSVGNMPVIMDCLKRSERLFDILEAVEFSILVENDKHQWLLLSPRREWMRSNHLYTGILEGCWMSQVKLGTVWSS